MSQSQYMDGWEGGREGGKGGEGRGNPRGLSPLIHDWTHSL